jgi:Peptidase M50B-like
MSLSNAHWKLGGCCHTEEKLFLIFYVFYWIITLGLWRTQVLKPLKLLAVLVHELGHASAACLTCGKVKSISVNANESGLASYSGGVQVSNDLDQSGTEAGEDRLCRSRRLIKGSCAAFLSMPLSLSTLFMCTSIDRVGIDLVQYSAVLYSS